MDDEVRAAGAVLWRPAADGMEICVVHRPYRADWSLPKGKLESGEHPLTAAVREVAEETGVTGVPQLRLPDVRYSLPDGRPKSVDFWLMRAVGGPAGDVLDPTEVDRVEWLRPAEACDRLTYPADRDLVAHVAGLPPVTAVVPLVRHAHAGERKKWKGDDALRPVDARGRGEAEALGVLLTAFRPARLFSATPLRCRQTLQPLADRLGLPVVTDGAFTEPADRAGVPARVAVAAARLAELRSGPPAVICSQGKVIPRLLARLAGADDPEPYKTPKGGAWVLSFSGTELIGMSRL